MNNIIDKPIVLFIRVFSRYGGVENVCYRFYKYLRDKDSDVKVVCGENKSDINDDSIITTGLWHPGRFLKGLSFNLKAKKYVRQFYNEGVTFAFDKIVGCHLYRTGGGSHLEYLLVSIKGFRGAKKITKIASRMINPANYYYILLEDRIFHNKNLQKIIALSDNVKQEVIKRFGLDERKVVIVNNGTDKSKFSVVNRTLLRNKLKVKYNINDSNVVIGFCSSNFERKGLSYMIDALKELPDNIIILVAGSRKTENYIKYAMKIGVDRRVFFLGKVEYMPEFYAALDLFCHPSYYDTFASVVVEALSMGIPVITTKEVGAHSVIKVGYNGYVLKQLTSKILSEYILKGLRLGFGEYSSYVYSDEDVFNKYLDIIMSTK